MTAKQLLAGYPEVKQAVAYVELVMCTTDENHPVTMWELLEVHKRTPHYMVETIRNLIEGETKEEQETPEAKAGILLAFFQTYHPQFLTYVAGKMGAM